MAGNDLSRVTTMSLLRWLKSNPGYSVTIDQWPKESHTFRLVVKTCKDGKPLSHRGIFEEEVLTDPSTLSQHLEEAKRKMSDIQREKPRRV